MDINFHDPSDIPLPPEEVRIRELRVEPLPDGRRVRIFTELTPFQQKPNLEIKIMTEAGSEAATLSIIEAIDYKMQFTFHLKDAQSPATYAAEMEVYYFEVDPPTQVPAGAQQDEIHQLPQRSKSVDQRQVRFTIGGAPHAA